jgi:hypothetical protein
MELLWLVLEERAGVTEEVVRGWGRVRRGVSVGFGDW